MEKKRALWCLPWCPSTLISLPYQDSSWWPVCCPIPAAEGVRGTLGKPALFPTRSMKLSTTLEGNEWVLDMVSLLRNHSLYKYITRICLFFLWTVQNQAIWIFSSLGVENRSTTTRKLGLLSTFLYCIESKPLLWQLTCDFINLPMLI
jgi:hypothetical protein